MEKRNTIIAFVLSAAIMFGWLHFFGKKPKDTVTENVQTPQAEVTENIDEEPVTAEKSDQISASIKTKGSEADDYDYSTLVEEEYSFKTDHYSFTLTNRGAKINSIKYGNREIELAVNGAGEPAALDYSFFLDKKDFLNKDPLSAVLWFTSEKNENRFVFTRNIFLDGKKVTVHKIYEFNKDSYYFDLTYVFSNENDEKVYFPEQQIIFSAADYIGPSAGGAGRRFNRIKQMYYTGKKKLLTKGGGGFLFFKKEATPSKEEEGDISWAGVIGRYFVTLLSTYDRKADGVIADTGENVNYRTGLVFKDSGIVSGKESVYKFKAVISEKNKSYLKSVDDSLESASDTNKWIDPIRVAVLWCLKQLNKFIPNYGWCIVVFSILSKLVFLPLTQKSAQSMKKMSSLQPEIQKLKTKYENDPTRMQQETMKLYKEKGVNPMGGCLPLVVQMPFFIALYSALGNSLDMWNTPFLLWITDLSTPETLFTVAGFDVRLLPIIMTITSFFQQKVSTVDTGAGDQQQMMLKMMPVILLFVFWSFPSGLIIYWSIQNVLQVGHQLIVNNMKKKTA